VILQRCFAWSRRARPDEQDGPLWVPRAFQGDGRHDNPDLYGCLYHRPGDLRGRRQSLASGRSASRRPAPTLSRPRLAALELDGAAETDLDDPIVPPGERLRLSTVATRRREVQPQACGLHAARPRCGPRWWSTFEASWVNYGLRSAPALSVVDVGSWPSSAVAEAAASRPAPVATDRHTLCPHPDTVCPVAGQPVARIPLSLLSPSGAASGPGRRGGSRRRG
jgi:hypothetical protein